MVRCFFEQQNSVRTDAAMAIAQMRNLGAIQMNVPCPVIDQDEIVSRAVHFREAQHDADCNGSPASCHVERSLPQLRDS